MMRFRDFSALYSVLDAESDVNSLIRFFEKHQIADVTCVTFSTTDDEPTNQYDDQNTDISKTSVAT